MSDSVYVWISDFLKSLAYSSLSTAASVAQCGGVLAFHHYYSSTGSRE